MALRRFDRLTHGPFHSHQRRHIARTIWAELEDEILKGHVSQDQVHLFVSCPPHVSASYLMQRVKGKSSWILLREHSHLNKAC